MNRRWWVLLHRWAGLLMAGFLVVAGLTGAIISWDHELDEWLNPHLLEAQETGAVRDPLQLAADIEARHPTVQVTYVPLVSEAGHSWGFGVVPRIDRAHGRLHEPGFNQVFVHPSSGEESGRREWGAVWPLSRENVVSFLYRLHYSLHVPAMWGSNRWGIWLMGVIALIWTLDCFTGAYLTLPARQRATAAVAGSTRRSFWQRWRPAWTVRPGGGTYRLNFDLHRAGSLWTWGLLFIVAFTAFSLNLYREVFLPVMSRVSDVTPTPFQQRAPAPLLDPVTPAIGFAQAIAAGRTEAVAAGWPQAPGSVSYNRMYGIYTVSFFQPEDGHGAGGAGHPRVWVDGLTGEALGHMVPWTGTAADLFVHAQFPLHSGRILGLPGRIAISVLGLVVAGLSVTGVYVWWYKRRGRVAKERAGQGAMVPAK